MSRGRWRRSRKDPPAQSMTGVVTGGPVAQIVSGGDVHLTLHEASLPYHLWPYPVPAALPPGVVSTRPAVLLQARYGVVPFTGREEELASLARWRDAPAGSAVMLLHGAGGQGKTRLAAEFARRSRAAGWQVLAASHHTDRPAAEAEAPPAPTGDGGPAGVLLVADTAERWPFADVLRMVLDASRHDPPTRVLLVARPAGAWWQGLSGALMERGLAVDSRELTALPAEPDLTVGLLFAQARDRFAEELGVVGAARVRLPAVLRADPDGSSVLAVHMTALVAVADLAHGAAPRPPSPLAAEPLTPEAVSATLLRYEQRHWQALATHQPQWRANHTDLAQATYTAALTGMLSEDQGLDALARIGVRPSHRADVLRAHAVAYPPGDRERVLAPLSPAPLAEDFLALTTPGHSVSDFGEPWAVRAPRHLLGGATPPVWTRSAVTALLGAATRWPHVRTRQLVPLLRERPEVMRHAGSAALAALAALDAVDPAVLAAVDDRLPEESTPDLDAGAAVLARRLLPHRLAEAGEDRAGRATAHARLSWRLSNAGWHRDALPPAETALALWRELADADAAFAPELARALSNHGHRLAHVGRWDDALAASEEALTRWQPLADADAARHGAGLATALTNHGHHLWQVGRWRDALAVSEEALARWRHLADADPADPDPSDAARREAELARSLGNVAALRATVSEQSGDDRWDEALTAARSAVRGWRRLAGEEPGHQPDLAASLSTYAVLLAQASRSSDTAAWQEALAAAREAVLLSGRLAGTHLDAHGPGHAIAAYNLGVLLTKQSRGDEAAAIFRTADELHRKLSVTTPDGMLPHPATARRKCTLRLSMRAEWALTPPLLLVTLLPDRDDGALLGASAGGEHTSGGRPGRPTGRATPPGQPGAGARLPAASPMGLARQASEAIGTRLVRLPWVNGAVQLAQTNPLLARAVSSVTALVVAVVAAAVVLGGSPGGGAPAPSQARSPAASQSPPEAPPGTLPASSPSPASSAPGPSEAGPSGDPPPATAPPDDDGAAPPTGASSPPDAAPAGESSGTGDPPGTGEPTTAPGEPPGAGTTEPPPGGTTAPGASEHPGPSGPPPCQPARETVDVPASDDAAHVVHDVDARSEGDVWAVGSSGAVNAPRGWAQHWDGTRWTQMLTSEPASAGGSGGWSRLFGVTAPDRNLAWAVGDTGVGRDARTLIERWDGTAWTRVNSPGPGVNDHLNDVWAPDAGHAWSVGSSRVGTLDRAYVLRWDGAQWVEEALPELPARSSVLADVTGSGPDDVWAVGHLASETSGYDPLLLHWDGTAWTRFPVPSPDGSEYLLGVSVVSEHEAWAVGHTDAPTAPLVLRWDGHAWSPVPGAAPPGQPDQGALGSAVLWSVAALPDQSVWVTGSRDGQRMMARWDGEQWAVLPPPADAGADGTLRGVTALASGSALAVGDDPLGHSYVERGRCLTASAGVSAPATAPLGGGALATLAALLAASLLLALRRRGTRRAQPVAHCPARSADPSRGAGPG